MNNIVCIRHRDYKGQGSPNLTCRICCGIYVQAIKKEVEQEKKATKDPVQEAYDWLQQKAIEAKRQEEK